MRALGFAMLVAAALLGGAVAAAAQMELGVIKGRVVDEAGQPLAGRDRSGSSTSTADAR